MRIGIDARVVHYQRAGIGQYTLRLAQALATVDSQNSYVILQSRKDSAPLVQGANLRRRNLWTPPHHRYEQWLAPLELFPIGLDVLHCPDFIPPFHRPCPAVITVHDLAFLRFPGILTEESRRYYGQIERAVHSAEHIIAVSESTKRDLVALAGADAGKITVVYEAAGPEFRPADAARIAAVRQRYGLQGDYILFVSTIEPRKNIPFLLEAYAQMRSTWPDAGEPPGLVLAGKQGWLYDSVFVMLEQLGLRDSAIFTGGVPVEDLPALYSGACCFVLPSLYEGFGLPVLEAMSCGTPVITTNVSSLPEVAGDAALLVDPQDMLGLSMAMQRLCQDEALRRDLSARGRAQAARFSWERRTRDDRHLQDSQQDSIMKILFLTPQLPYPPDKGATIRTLALIKGLAQRGHHIHLLSFVNAEEDSAWLPQLRPYCPDITTVVAPVRSTWVRLRTLLFSSQPDMAGRFPSAEFASRLSALLASGFDIVQAESLEMAQYALQVARERSSGGKRPLVIFDDLNAEYMLQKRAFEVDRQLWRAWPKALYSWLQYRRLRRYEQRVCQTVDEVLAVSETDAASIAALAGHAPRIIPNGVDCIFFSPEAQPAEYPPETQIKHLASLIFTGTMDFRPNADAVLWFCQDILPLIKKDAFHVHFYIAGQHPTAAVRALASPAVTVTGYVSDIRPYIANSVVYVVPMRMGSGTKLKVMQAMAMRIPVVSTTMGAEGIDVTGGQNILLADTPQDFARHVVALLGNESERQRLAANGRRLVEERYDWTTIVPVLEKVYTQALLST